MRSNEWIQKQHREVGEALVASARAGRFGFANVIEAFDLIAHDGPTCSAARLLAGHLRPIPLEDLMSAAADGKEILCQLGAEVRDTLRTAADDTLRSVKSVPEAADVFRSPAGDYAAAGDIWTDRPTSKIASVALALQAIEWTVHPPREQVISY